jgi:hypothetical protein
MMSEYRTEHGFYIPERMMGGLLRYINNGVPTGNFLYSVLCNDLQHAVGYADEENLRNLPAYVMYLYNEAPSTCWGSPEKVAAYLIYKHDEVRRANLYQYTPAVGAEE